LRIANLRFTKTFVKIKTNTKVKNSQAMKRRLGRSIMMDILEKSIPILSIMKIHIEMKRSQKFPLSSIPPSILGWPKFVEQIWKKFD